MKNEKGKIPSSPQSPHSLVLRFMREKRQLTIFFVGKEVGIKPKNVDHMESGRRIVKDDELPLFLELYGFSLEQFNEMIKIKPLNKQAANHYFLANTK
jgi:hypothetical protein